MASTLNVLDIEMSQTKGSNFELCGHHCCIYALHRAKGLSVTSFVKLFSPTHYNCKDIRAVRMFRAQFGECPT